MGNFAVSAQMEHRIVSVFSNTGVDYLQPMDWTPNGKKILALLFTKGGGTQIALFDASGGQIPQKLTTFSGTRVPGNLTLSPDGHFMAYDLPQDEKSSARDVLILNVADGGYSDLSGRRQ